MNLITEYRQKKLKEGIHSFLSPQDETKLQFKLLQMRPHQEYSLDSLDTEMIILVIYGEGKIRCCDEEILFQRKDWIHQNPHVLHLSCNKKATVISEKESRLAIIQGHNTQEFPLKIFSPKDIQVEHRGKDILDGTCYRHVRLVFDKDNAPLESQLVLGEVLNFPGKWSSFPPHHHPQSEIYYYEFSPDWGYGHGEWGEAVYKIHHQDLLKITHNKDHSQVAAPGCHLYYIWAIRHLPKNPYTGFEFTEPFQKLCQN